MTNPVVWFEVIGHDADKLRSFYRDLLGWSFQLDPVTKHGIVEPEAGSAGISRQVPFTSNFHPWYEQRRPSSSLRPKNIGAPRCGQ